MKNSENKRSENNMEPDRIGQMGGKRSTIHSQISRRLYGFKGRPKGKSIGPGSLKYPQPQRVIVKVHVCRHKPGKAMSTLRRHVSYIGRESASVDGKPGVFFDAQKEAKGQAAVTGWEADRHHFRLIISPERGADIPDLQAYTREVMRRVERDLGTPLEWIAVGHHNTDNPHVHVLLRGKRADGQDLVIPRQYISRGMRDRASEVATEILGERTPQEVHAVKVQEVTAERFTSLDRMIERHLERGKLDASPQRPVGFAAEDRTLILGRLQFLKTIDLAQKARGTHWQVHPEFKTILRDLGARNDLIRQLYADMGREAGNVERIGPQTQLPLTGVVVAKGSVDEISEVRFLVLRDADGRAHYAQVSADAAYARLQPGSVAQVGNREVARRAQAEEILAVADTHGGQYDGNLHTEYLRQKEAGLSSRDAAARVRSATGRLGFLSDYSASGVSQTGEGRYQIDAEKFRAFSQRPARQMDAQVVAAYPLAEQVTAQVWTWLDQQRERPGGMVLLDRGPVAEAMQERQAWLVAQGYATASATGVTLRPDAQAKLTQHEQTAKDRELAERYGKPVHQLPSDARITGVYQGVQERHSGLHAVIMTGDQIMVAPVAREPSASVGATVTARQRSGQSAAVIMDAARFRDLEAGR